MLNENIKKSMVAAFSSLIMTTSLYSDKVSGLILNTKLYNSEPTDLVYSGNQKEILNITKKRTSSILKYEPKRKINKSENQYGLIEKLNNINKTKKLIWKIEYDHFLKYFNLEGATSEEVHSKVEEFTLDWILWPVALKKVYKEIYSKDLENCSANIKKRWEIYLEMSKYSIHKKYTSNWKIYNRWQVDVFSKKYYYWELNTQNKNLTYIDSNLIHFVENKINKKWTQAFYKTINWKKVVLLYINWNLEFASYTSPWNTKKYWKNAWLPRNWRESIYNKSNHKIDKYHISWASASVKTIWWKKYWAKMPYAVHIVWWIYIHAWKTNWMKRSHWCFRLPLFYAKWFYELFGKHWNIKWNIKTN